MKLFKAIMPIFELITDIEFKNRWLQIIIKFFYMIDKIIERYDGIEFFTFDGFDEAIIGVEESEMKLIYSSEKCIEIISKDMCKEQAIEYFYFNVVGMFIGEKTPIICFDDFGDDD